MHNGKAGAIFIPNIKTSAKNGFKQTLTEFSASDVTRSFTKGSWPKQGHSHLFGWDERTSKLHLLSNSESNASTDDLHCNEATCVMAVNDAIHHLTNDTGSV